MNQSASPILIDTFWNGQNRTARNIILAVTGSLLLWASAKIQIPFYPVPMTMQTFVVLAVGMAFGWWLGSATVILYLVEGAAGLTVFAGTPEKGLGIAYMAGPTGGYLLGFVMAAAIVGWLAERGYNRDIVRTGLAMLIGNAVIYLPGLFWLATVVGWDKPIYQWGMAPFLFGDLAKLILAAVLMPLLWKFASANTAKE